MTEITDCAHMGAVPYEDASPADREGMRPGQWRCTDDGTWRLPVPVPPCRQVFDDSEAWRQALQVQYAAHRMLAVLSQPGLYGLPLDIPATIALASRLLSETQTCRQEN